LQALFELPGSMLPELTVLKQVRRDNSIVSYVLHARYEE